MRKIIFDLDRTLWRCTVEYHPRLKRPPIHKETHEILNSLQQKGYSLNIASRSLEPKKCNYFLDKFFPNITFDHRAIYYTPRTKFEHLYDIGITNGEFVMFDDEVHILKDIKRTFPESSTILCEHVLKWDTIKSLKL